MTNEEYIKSYKGKDFVECVNRFFAKNELAPYIDWERWLPNERSTYFFKGVEGTYMQNDGTIIPCTVVEKVSFLGTKAYRIIIFFKGRNYLLTTTEERVEIRKNFN